MIHSAVNSLCKCEEGRAGEEAEERQRRGFHQLRDGLILVGGPADNRVYCLSLSLSFFNILLLRERQVEHERGRGRERGRHRIQSRLQALSRQHRARRGLELTNCEIMT